MKKQKINASEGGRERERGTEKESIGRGIGRERQRDL